MKNILVIDDDKAIRESIKELLELVDYKVTVSEDGTKGIKSAAEFPPDLIICDVSMPIMDGYAVLNELNKSPKTSGIPFIFLTAKAEMCDLRAGMHLGADDYIVKPYTANELLKSIEHRLQKKEKIIESISSVNYEKPDNSGERKITGKESRIIVMVNDAPFSIKAGDILYIEALEKYSNVYLLNSKKVLVRKLLKEWEQILPPDLFLRIHRKTIIGLEHVKKFEKWFNHTFRVFINEVEIPFTISRRFSSKLRKFM